MKNSNGPRVSVVVPAYNHERYVAQCISSVLAQEFSQFEIVLIDDGSSDDTFNVARQFVDANSERLTLLRQTNRGISSTLNTCIEMSRGALIAMLASDDYMLPGRLKDQVEFLDENPEVDIVHTDVLRVAPDGRPSGTLNGTYRPAVGVPFEDFLLGRVGICAPSVMFRRKVWEEVGGFDVSFPIEDWPFYLAAARHGFRFGYVDRPLTAWRASPGSLGRSTSKHWRGGLRIVERYLAGASPEFASRVRRRVLRYELRSAVLQGQWAVAAEILSEIPIDRSTVQWGARLIVRKLAQVTVRSVAGPELQGLLRRIYGLLGQRIG